MPTFPFSMFDPVHPGVDEYGEPYQAVNAGIAAAVKSPTTGREGSPGGLLH